MLPNVDNQALDFEEEQAKTQTFGFNRSEKYVYGKVDGLEALEQSIYLALHIEADQHIIYPYTYGIKKVDLIGKPNYYVAAVLPERIRDALVSDDRITDVSDFEFETNKNKLSVRFVVHTIYGDINEETEVVY